MGYNKSTKPTYSKRATIKTLNQLILCATIKALNPIKMKATVKAQNLLTVC